MGWASTSVGDLDGDGIDDLAVGAVNDDDGGNNRGAIYILFLNADGTVKAEQKISDTAGSFFGVLNNGDLFGYSLALLGDQDGDGTPELAVGAIGDDDGGAGRGAIWLLSLNPNGTVKGSRKISQTSGGFFGSLSNGDAFGASVANIGDFNGDMINDIVVGAVGDDSGGANRGAVWVLALATAGNVLASVKISDTVGSFTGGLSDGDSFGVSVASLGDLNGSGRSEVAVGANGDDTGGLGRGAVYVLFLAASGQVASHTKIASGAGVTLADGDAFGTSVAFVSDRNQDGVGELVVGAPQDDGLGVNRGAFHVIDIDTAAGVDASRRFSEAAGLDNTLVDGDFFGRSVCTMGDIDGDGFDEVFVGSVGDDDGFADAGAGTVVFLDCVAPAVATFRNGTNPATFLAVNSPIIGATWNSTIDIVTPGALASFVQISFGGPTAPIPLSGIFKGELLILPPFGPLDLAVGAHAMPVPYDCTLVATTFSVQGGTFLPACLQLTNALDLTFGTY